MNWEQFWDNVSSASNDEVGQVQRKDLDSVRQTVDHIVENLQLSPQDDVLDVCCGNGLVTALVAEYCGEIIGVDISSKQIEQAKRNYPNITFLQSPADCISSVLPEKKFDKIYLQFSFQYLTKKGEGERAIAEMLHVLKPGGMIFMGDIPDHDKLWTFYNTFWKRFYLLVNKLRGRSKLGKFWHKKEIDAICKRLKCKGNAITQPKQLPYSHYRFDYLITR